MVWYTEAEAEFTYVCPECHYIYSGIELRNLETVAGICTACIEDSEYRKADEESDGFFVWSRGKQALVSKPESASEPDSSLRTITRDCFGLNVDLIPTNSKRWTYVIYDSVGRILYESFGTYRSSLAALGAARKHASCALIEGIQ